MGLRDRLQPGHFGLGKHTATPQQAQRALARALERQQQRCNRADTEPVDIELLGQVTSSAEWPKLLAYWERRNPAGVGTWPRRLGPSEYALNLWPFPAGRLPRTASGGDVRKRQPKKLLCTPGLTVFDVDGPRADAATALAIVCTSWLEDVGTNDFEAIRVAPPILETWATGGRLISREVIDFGLEWSRSATTVASM
jgi:hypothetical protein